MSAKILLTSFQTWLPHQKSNSSDDLLEQIETVNFTNLDLIFLRKLPVHTAKASYQTIKQIKHLQPDFVICCGMAESRTLLTIESNATWREQKIDTSIDLEKLVEGLSFTQISQDAGKFV
jgi:pyroglutamyl-peptidase